MYTAELVSSIVDKRKRRRIVRVRFFDGANDFNQDFEFTINEGQSEMKKKVKQYLDELNFVPEEITGDIADYVEPAEDQGPTAAELAKAEWYANLAKLREVQELIELGVLTGNEGPVKALQNKVKADFRQAYIA